MRVVATPVKARELKPGDLFSVIGPSYWEFIDGKDSLGERVYIRTNAPTPPDQAEHQVYRIEIKENKMKLITLDGTCADCLTQGVPLYECVRCGAWVCENDLSEDLCTSCRATEEE